MDIDQNSGQVMGRTDVLAPPHEPGLLPGWLADQGAMAVVCGGMGQRAQVLFGEKGIQVVVGRPLKIPSTWSRLSLPVRCNWATTTAIIDPP